MRGYPGDIMPYAERLRRQRERRKAYRAQHADTLREQHKATYHRRRSRKQCVRCKSKSVAFAMCIVCRALRGEQRSGK